MRWQFALLLVVWAFVFSGCTHNGSNGKNKKTISAVDHHSESDLQQSLEKFEEFFANTITDASEELDRLSGSSRPNRSTLKLRSVTIKAAGTMLGQDEPLTAFVDAWVLSARLSRYYQQGLGSKSFEPSQHVVVDAVKKIESAIENIGLEYLDNGNFEMTRQKVHEFAKANPIKRGLTETVLFASEAYQGQANPFEEILILPLLPLTMVKGVSEGVTGTGKIADSADHVADVVEAFPESARLQLLMLLYDIEKLDSVKTTVESFEKFSKSSSRFADSADKLPEKLRMEIVELLKEVEEKSNNIRKTIDSADRTASNITQALGAGDKLTKSINEMSEKIALTAQAWKGAADSTDAAVSRMIQFSGPEDKKVDINAYRETAVEMNVLADKIPAIFDHANQYTKKLTRRIAALIFLTFAMAIALTIIIIRTKTRSASAGIKPQK